MQRIADRWAIFISQRRPVFLAIVVALAGLLASQALRVEAAFSPQALFADMPEARETSEAMKALFGSEENGLVLLVRAPDLFDPTVLTWLRDVRSEGDALPFVEEALGITGLTLPRQEGGGVLRVDNPLSQSGDVPVSVEAASELRRAVEGFRFLHGLIVRPEANVALIVFSLRRDTQELSQVAPWVREIQERVAARPPPPGVTLQWGGLPDIRTYAVDKLISDQFVLIPLAALTNLLLLLFAFRWIPGVFLPLVVVGLSMAMVVGTMALAGIPFNLVNNVLPTLIIVIGVSDAIHVLSRYREHIEGGAEHHGAIRQAMRSMTISCLFTSLTTAIGFGSLMVSQTAILRSFGASAAYGVMLAWVVTVTLLPATLAFCSPHRATHRKQADAWLDRLGVTLHRWVTHHTNTVLAVSALLMGVGGWLGARVVIDSKLMEIFSPDDHVYQATRALEQDFGGVLSLQIILQADRVGLFDQARWLDEVRRFEERLSEEPGTLGVRSYLTYLDELHVAFTGREEVRGAPMGSDARVASLRSLVEGVHDDPFSPYIDPTRTTLRIVVRIPDDGGVAILRQEARFRAHFVDVFGDEGPVTFTLTGDAFLGALGLSVLIWDLIGSIGTALLVIFVFLLLLFRSLPLGLLAFPPNAVPLVLTLGYMGWQGIALNSTTLIIFSVSLGLAVDNTIHVVRRFQEELKAGRHRDEALEAAMRGTGRAVLVSAATLLAGLSVVLFSSFVPIRLFAELTALTVVSCVIADLLLLPALLHRFWPAGPVEDVSARCSEGSPAGAA